MSPKEIFTTKQIRWLSIIEIFFQSSVKQSLFSKKNAGSGFSNVKICFKYRSKWRFWIVDWTNEEIWRCHLRTCKENIYRLNRLSSSKVILMFLIISGTPLKIYSKLLHVSFSRVYRYFKTITEIKSHASCEEIWPFTSFNKGKIKKWDDDGEELAYS